MVVSKGDTMERLEFIKENWYVEDEESKQWATNMVLPDFRGEEKECWHLRGRGWKWLTLRNFYSELQQGQEYVISFWAKFDYYIHNSSKCFIILYEHWENRIVYDINPDCIHAVKKAGDWYLYQFPIKLEYGCELKIEIIAWESNVALVQARPEDEKDSLVADITDKAEEPYHINQELPFREYTYLEQRMVKYYWNLLAPYYPTKELPEACQSEYYEFVRDLYDGLFTKPEAFFTKLYEDDAHPNRFNCREYGKPDLKVHMKKDRDKIEALFQLLIVLWSEGDVTEDGLIYKTPLSKSQQNMLTYMNFEVTDGMIKHKKYANIGQAIQYLAGKDKPLWALMSCWFDATYPYLEYTYEKCYDKEQYQRLTQWLKENGYLNSIGSCSGVTLDYYKCSSKGEKQIGYAIHGDKYHYGFTFEYRPDPRIMQHCEPRIIQFGDMLKQYDELSENTKKLILQRTKRCDGCRYCIQTDKTGKRPMAAIKLVDGTSRCPYYPGFNYSFERLSKEDVDNIIAFLTDLEQVVLHKER
jgi:hypothetical protein